MGRNLKKCEELSGNGRKPKEMRGMHVGSDFWTISQVVAGEVKHFPGASGEHFNPSLEVLSGRFPKSLRVKSSTSPGQKGERCDDFLTRIGMQN